MPKRLKIKRLSLPFTLFDECGHDDKWNCIAVRYNEDVRSSLKSSKVIQPPIMINTDGRYLTKCACWLECEGVAYEYDRKSFLHDMRLLEAAELSMDTYRALLAIERLDRHLLGKKQKKLIRLKARQLELLKLRRESNKLLLTHPL